MCFAFGDFFGTVTRRFAERSGIFSEYNIGLNSKGPKVCESHFHGECVIMCILHNVYPSNLSASALEKSTQDLVMKKLAHDFSGR